MITIENVEALHLQLPANSNLASTLVHALIEQLRGVTGGSVLTTVQTSEGAAFPPALGEVWPGQGGRYGGTMPARDGQPGYHLVVGPQTERRKFGPYDTDVTGAIDHHDGQANTGALLAHASEHPAALWAYQQEIEDHKDFYLPAHAELCQLWINVPQLFEKSGWYWSSTQYSPGSAWAQDFENGGSDITNKRNELRAVAVRRLAL